MFARLNPVRNLLASDIQYAYKSKRSTIDILSMVNNQLRNNTAKQLILFDFSKAFGNIARDITWAKLYESGLPRNFIRLLKMGHEGNRLQPKCDGYIGNYETNNKGVFQGSPLSATLFKIYAEQMIKPYNKNLPDTIRGNALRNDQK